jgi:hypothetical protein
MDWKEIRNEGLSRGHWATPSEIQERIKQRQKSKSKEALIIFSVVAFGMATMLGLIFYLI